VTGPAGPKSRQCPPADPAVQTQEQLVEEEPRSVGGGRTGASHGSGRVAPQGPAPEARRRARMVRRRRTRTRFSRPIASAGPVAGWIRGSRRPPRMGPGRPPRPKLAPLVSPPWLSSSFSPIDRVRRGFPRGRKATVWSEMGFKRGERRQWREGMYGRRRRRRPWRGGDGDKGASEGKGDDELVLVRHEM
jgi:hypothetical protein